MASEARLGNAPVPRHGKRAGSGCRAWRARRCRARCLRWRWRPRRAAWASSAPRRTSWTSSPPSWPRRCSAPSRSACRRAPAPRGAPAPAAQAWWVTGHVAFCVEVWRAQRTKWSSQPAHIHSAALDEVALVCSSAPCANILRMCALCAACALCAVCARAPRAATHRAACDCPQSPARRKPVPSLVPIGLRRARAPL